MCANLYRNPTYELQKYNELQEKKDNMVEGSNTEKEEEEAKKEPSEAEKLFKEKYHHLDDINNAELSQDEVQTHFDEFLKDIFIEISLKIGIIEDIVVTGNFNHLNGNVYIKFRSEKNADLAVANLNSRWYDSKPVFAELSPVQDFDQAICGTYYETGSCSRSVNCNFWHVKRPSKGLKKELFDGQRKYYKENGLRN